MADSCLINHTRNVGCSSLCGAARILLWLTVAQCSGQGWGQSVVVPRGPCKQLKHSPSQRMSKVLQSYPRCHFIISLLPCPSGQVLNRHTSGRWSGASIPSPVSMSSGGTERYAQSSIAPLVLKMLRQRGDALICVRYTPELYMMEVIDCNILAKFQSVWIHHCEQLSVLLWFLLQM